MEFYNLKNMIYYSFIIPHHNTPNLLNRCLESIPQREDIEIIIVDDNSDADKKPFIKRSDVKLICIDAAHSNGAGHARNCALKETKGKWLVFADADDFFPKNFMSVFDEYKDSDIDVVYHNIIMVDTETLQPYKGYMDKEMSIVSKYDGSKDSELEVRYRLNAPWWKIVKRELIEKYRIRFEEVPKGNDIFYSIQVGYFAKRIVVLDTPLYVYTYNRNSISNRKKDEHIYFNEFCLRNRVLGIYKTVGHPEWIMSKCRLWLRLIKHDGLFVCVKTFLMYYHNHKYLKQCLSDYVNMINNTKKEKGLC